MVRSFGVRFFAIVALIFGAGFANVATAAPTSFPHQLERLDLGDDDGDGIPNYLDPDDNDDGIPDRETPPTPVPTSEPIDEAPDDVETPTENPVQDTEPETEPEQAPPTDDTGSEAAQEAVPEAPAQAAAPQVSSLPNTGTAPPDSGSFITPSALVLVVLGAGGMLLIGKRR